MKTMSPNKACALFEKHCRCAVAQFNSPSPIVHIGFVLEPEDTTPAISVITETDPGPKQRTLTALEWLAPSLFHQNQ